MSGPALALIHSATAGAPNPLVSAVAGSGFTATLRAAAADVARA
jgi:hypothetical protein